MSGAPSMTHVTRKRGHRGLSWLPSPQASSPSASSSSGMPVRLLRRETYTGRNMTTWLLWLRVS